MHHERIIRLSNGVEIEFYRDVYNKYYNELCYAAYRLVKDKEIARDLTSDSLAKLLANENETFNEPDNIKKLLRKMLNESCIDYIRKNDSKQTYQSQVKYLHIPTDNVIERLYDKAEILKKIYAQIEQLPVREKEVFKLIYLEGYSKEDVAKKLGTSPNTVRTQQAKALDKLRKTLGDKEFIILLWFICKTLLPD